jgi:multisubunit Na+/H+ antiporter MnhE subunit
VSGAGHLLRYWARWWVICTALWLLLTSTVSLNDVLTGFAVAVIAAGAAPAVEAVGSGPSARTIGRDADGARRWVRWVAALPGRIVMDTWWVTVALVDDLRGRRAAGRFNELDLGAAHAREDVLTLLTTAAPNHILVSLDDQRRVAVVHELVRRDVGTLDQLLARS